ncbi:MAG: MaoC family dehydratase [Deltaproteobacteria bacterium]|nr:MaoC family dehydratase [Deltaproteobacteria bacterium]
MKISEDEVYVGKDLGGQEVAITADLADRYGAATGDRHPFYTEGPPGEGPIAPSLILVNEVYAHPGWYLENVFGNLHAKQEWEIFRPIALGETARTRCTVVDRYIKRDRDYIVNESHVIDGQGRLSCRGRTHQSFLLDDAPAGLDVERKSKEKKERPPHPSTIAGESLEPFERKVTLEMSRAFSGPSENYHTNEELAQQLGFPKVLVQGMLSTCLVGELMTRRFGLGWYLGGRMSVNLTGIVRADDTVTTRATITGETPEGLGRRVHLAVWSEKSDGTLTLVGSASALAGRTSALAGQK